ncbi:MAG TPA: Gfo/Idh/MocA family oxidoreductase [Mesorhizobium sp.]|jgi:predicted dehydrogenase|uniref:Gfo/Idh/MocA family protein n=1 Tax=Mesorhizobium sp. TaxID=1871066 RepID=UPI002DDD550B|nr:Gfo/Idh/MocA family oxidoreductase [Mesorhizobium sp.]HEV2505064.1 Gfo/Idh/MocA family oxidoreductase [Mesorhizobium sp.]
MSRLRLGVVGLGMASAPHARSLLDLADRAEVVAAYSPTPARREDFARDYGLPTCEDSAAIFDDDNIDAVLILTPPNTHLELVRRAAATGKHILLEKPLETSLQRAQALLAATDAAGVKLGVVLQHRFRPTGTALAELLRGCRLGTLVSASVRLNNWRPQSYYDQPGRGTRERDGGGVLLTQAIHTLDLLISVAGTPSEVTAYAVTSPVHEMETEDLVAGAMRFDNGAIGSLTATTSAYPGHPDAIDIIGTKGMARLEGTKLSAAFHDGSDFHLEDEGAGGGTGADPMAFSHQHHRAVLADFLDAVATGSQPKVDGHEALKVHRLIDALLRSADSGTPRRVETL